MISQTPPKHEDHAAVAVRELDGFRRAEDCLSLLGGEGGFLLESAGPPGRLATWSLLGFSPVARFVSRGESNLFRLGGDGPSWQWREAPLAALRRALAFYPSVGPVADLPFVGGAVGLFAYELGRRLLPLNSTAIDDLELPDISLFFFETCLLFNESERKAFAVAYARDRRKGGAQELAERRADVLMREYMASASGSRETATDSRQSQSHGESLSLRSAMSAWEYQEAVQRCRREILDGNAYELCLTTRFEAEFSGDGIELYRRLREMNAAPFASYFKHPEITLVGSSPERFLSLSSDGIVEARPIKGTRSRGKDRAEDERLRKDLVESEKDRAENIMIVDLLRNDLHKVCVPGTVAVPELCVIEDYPSVLQMVSSITGTLRPDRDRLDLLAASFPGGSMTGAPKIAAMNLLEEMEGRVRGYYSGVQGYLGFDGAMDLSIVIRSAQLFPSRAIVGAGGAVVYDSDPEAEWQEALQKASMPLQALAQAQGYRSFALREVAAARR